MNIAAHTLNPPDGSLSIIYQPRAKPIAFPAPISGSTVIMRVNMTRQSMPGPPPLLHRWRLTLPIIKPHTTNSPKSSAKSAFWRPVRRRVHSWDADLSEQNVSGQKTWPLVAGFYRFVPAKVTSATAEAFTLLQNVQTSLAYWKLKLKSQFR